MSITFLTKIIPLNCVAGKYYTTQSRLGTEEHKFTCQDQTCQAGASTVGRGGCARWVW